MLLFMIKIGLLPLYIKLYDDTAPEVRPRMEQFYETAAQKLEACGFEVLRVPFCRIEAEFKSAIGHFESGGAMCIVTLHIAYSPSLESADALAGTKLPIVVLDATDTFAFDPTQDPDNIMYCHGVHGVMDMCSILNQRGKKFAIAAGYLEDPDVISRIAGFVRAAVAAASLCGSRVGLVGGSFFGMGDFAVEDKEIRERFGVEIVRSKPEDFAKLIASVTDSEIDEEIKSDCDMFQSAGDFSRETHVGTARDALALRKWIDLEKLSAFSVNFLKIGDETGLYYMPFMEACKAMGRGTGYAGEGDVLTASFAGALLRGFPDSSFVEIFCPDWKGNTLFLSHMGEMNIRLTAKTPVMSEKNFSFGNGANPVFCHGCYKKGEGMFVNICKGNSGFRLVFSPVDMEEEDEGEDNFKGTIRGWMRPEIPLDEFLEQLSKAGATHHSIFVYGAPAEQIRFFGELLDLEVVEI